jgi:hypothetical protein
MVSAAAASHGCCVLHLSKGGEATCLSEKASVAMAGVGPRPRYLRAAGRGGVVGAGHPSLSLSGWKKPHASRVGLPRWVMKSPRGILYAFTKPQNAFKRVTRKGMGGAGAGP